MPRADLDQTRPGDLFLTVRTVHEPDQGRNEQMYSQIPLETSMSNPDLAGTSK
jgi:hypothetical protein